jgi:hypothetical protein
MLCKKEIRLHDLQTGGTHGPWPGNQTTGLPTISNQPLSLGDLLGLNPNGPCDFGVCNPVGNGLSPADTTIWSLPTLTRICVAVPGCVEIALGVLAGVTLVLQRGDANPCVNHPDTQQCTKEAECEAQYEEDLNTCRGLASKAARARCYESAANRKQRCLQGWNPLPPLITW